MQPTAGPLDKTHALTQGSPLRGVSCFFFGILQVISWWHVKAPACLKQNITRSSCSKGMPWCLSSKTVIMWQRYDRKLDSGNIHSHTYIHQIPFGFGLKTCSQCVLLLCQNTCANAVSRGPDIIKSWDLEGQKLFLMHMMTDLLHWLWQSKKIICMLWQFALSSCSFIEPVAACAFTEPNLSVPEAIKYCCSLKSWWITSSPEVVAFGPVLSADWGLSVWHQSGWIWVTFLLLYITHVKR